MKCKRCGHCCRTLILEASASDAKREPRLRAECLPIKDTGGYFLNGFLGDMACRFLDKETNLCSIYPTRPQMCRDFKAGGHNCRFTSCRCEFCATRTQEVVDA